MFLSIFFGIILGITIYYYFNMTVAEAESFTNSMSKGIIPRIPISLYQQRGVTLISELPEGRYAVTGGSIELAYVERYKVVKVVSILVNDVSTDTSYRYGNQPFNLNFAKVLYELRAANMSYVSTSFLDCDSTGKLSSTPYYYNYLQDMKTHLYQAKQEQTRTCVTNYLLNNLAEMT